MNTLYNTIKFKTFVKNLRRKINVHKRDIIFICIGTNKVIGDSLGPQVGEILKENLSNNIVIGNMNKTICRKTDLIAYDSIIRNKFVIAIDSAFSFPGLIGEIFITESPIFMGMAFDNNQGSIGNIAIKGVVSELTDNKEQKIKRLKKVDNCFIKNLSQFIGNGIIKAIE